MRGYERKLCVGLVLIAMAFLPSLGFALFAMHGARMAQEKLDTRYMRTVMLTQTLRTRKLLQNALMPAYVLSGDEGLLRTYDQAAGEFDAALSELKASPLPAGVRDLLGGIEAGQAELRSKDGPGVRMRQEGRTAAEVDAYFRSHAVPLTVPLVERLDALVDRATAEYEARRDRDDWASRLAYRVLAGTCAVSILLCGAALLLLLRLINHKRAQDVLREEMAARESEVSAARKQAVETVAHDLKNPLAAIAMASERLVGKGDGNGPEARMARVISASACSMDLLIRNLLDHAKIEAGGLCLAREPTDVGAAVAVLCERMGFLARERGISLVNEVPAHLPPVEVDPVRIEQVLSNILGNALKFTPRGGRVGIGHATGDGALTLTISDTGPGMSGEQAARVFERHWQAEDAGAKGNGLGLAISKAIVEAHGGTLSLRTAPGQGAAFDVRIPAAVPVPAVAA